MRTGFDVSDPTGPKPGFDVACGYLGGLTPHVWTPQQWAEQPARWRLPFWLPDFLVDPVVQANAVLVALDSLRWPKGTYVCWDLETRVATSQGTAWYNKAADRLHLNGYFSISYGSTGNLFGWPIRSGYFPADWTGQPHMYEHPHAVATQWTDQGQSGGQRVDESVLLDQTALALWDTRPLPPPADEGWEAAALAQAKSVAADAAALAVFIGAHVP